MARAPSVKTTTSAPGERWLTAIGAACVLGCNTATVKRLARRGRITYRDLGARARFSAASVEALARSSVHRATVEERL